MSKLGCGVLAVGPDVCQAGGRLIGLLTVFRSYGAGIHAKARIPLPYPRTVVIKADSPVLICRVNPPIIASVLDHAIFNLHKILRRTLAIFEEFVRRLPMNYPH